MTRIDRAVDFNWGYGSPGLGIGPDTFSVRWAGQVLAPSTGTFTFYTHSDDGVRLWVDGRLLIDQWNDHAAREHSGSISLEEGLKYDIRLEYYENDGAAVAQLLWSGPSTPKAVIPQNRLYSRRS